MEDWIVEVPGDIANAEPLRYVDADEFDRRKAAEKVAKNVKKDDRRGFSGSRVFSAAASFARAWWGKRARRKMAEIKDTMSEQEIRDAGLMIDLPTEAASSNPQPLRYEDGSTSDDPDKPWNVAYAAREARAARDARDAQDGKKAS